MLGSDMDLLPHCKALSSRREVQHSTVFQGTLSVAFWSSDCWTVDLGLKYSKPALHALSSLCKYLIPGVCRGLIGLFFRKHEWLLSCYRRSRGMGALSQLCY